MESCFSRMPTNSAPAAQGAILVIEPDILVRITIAEYLRECGYKVLEGVTAEDVVAVLGDVHTGDQLNDPTPMRRLGPVLFNPPTCGMQSC
jgi:hypothetical protein